MQREIAFAESQRPVQQYCMRRLQVFNWGTFSGLHDISIAEEGFLFVGRSGSGKSTLLDALSALLVPPAWLVFNAAAREGDKGRHDRDTASYIRGAWADQKDADSGEIATQYLRSGTTWSALAVEYANRAGQAVSLVQLLWLRGSSNRGADVRRHYIIAERPFNIAVELKDFDLDLRRLKQKHVDVRHFDTFSGYSEHFRRLLGIESEMALKLLHKTQSAKNLGDLNSFLREFMLDRPRTFEVAERLVEEFAELDAAHQAVVTAREQVDTLRPARDAHRRYQAIGHDLVNLDGLLAGVDAYRDRCKMGLLEAEIERLRTDEQGLEGLERRQLEALENQNVELKALEARHREQGGGHIEALEDQKHQAERQRDERVKKRGQAEFACKQLDWALPDSPQAYAEIAARARDIVERWKEHDEELREKQFALLRQKEKTEVEFAEARREIEAMQRQPSNISAHMLELRRRLTGDLGLAEGELPFVGELIEVKPEEAEWRGAIERVLRGFALSLLVEERYYASVSAYVNDTQLHGRLFYYRVAEEAGGMRQGVHARSLVQKLSIKGGVFRPWLEAELRRRFDYACVDNMRDFRQTERALTREGQIRHGKSAHEKDDRHAIDDHSQWVLGFDNREKLRLYRERAQQLAGEISGLSQKLQEWGAEKERELERFKACHTLANLQWQEIDVAVLLDRIQALSNTLKELRSGNRALQELHERIEKQKDKVKHADEALRETRVQRREIDSAIKNHGKELTELQSKQALSALTEHQQEGLKTRFESTGKTLTLKNLEPNRTRVEREINEEQKGLRDEQTRLERVTEQAFGRFKRTWPQDSVDLDETLASASEFIALLERLERDDLPRHERRFFDMLRERSMEQLSALNTHMTEARKEIRDRMELVNEGLAQADFNPGTHLEIVVGERHLEEVARFKQQIKQVLENAWLAERADAEARFNILRELVTRLGSAESDKERWREQVLDVRLHVEFMGREFDAEGREVEIYRSGAGKSGGQREKLATTCLAAALRYQLGGSDGGLPLYAPVVLDEAFGKADNEFTELGIKIFTKFGFQMIVATPLKSVMTLEPFIGGACFVDISDRKRSATLQIEYDHERHRLNLPEKTRGEVLAN